MERLQRKFTEQRPQRSIKDIIKSKFMITPENIAYSVFPIVEAIHAIEPDFILALDRGGRIVGMATYMLYQELYGSLPSQDHAIHFQKISRRVPTEVIHKRLEPFAKNALTVSDFPTVFVIDDWMNTGITKAKLDHVLAELSDNRITTYYGVLRGRGENVIGDRLSLTLCTWHNASNLIGVEYTTETGLPQSVHSQDALLLRRTIAENIKQFAERVLCERNAPPESQTPYYVGTINEGVSSV